MKISRADGLTIVLAAGLLTLAYPPFGLVWPAFLCMVPAALLVLRGSSQHDPWRWRLHVGFWYGTVTHAVLLYWLAGALWSYERHAVVLYGLAALMFGAATAVVFAVVGRIADPAPGRLVLALPAGVVLLEWLAGQAGPIALPWHQLALTVTSAPTLVQIADVAGAEGLGFLITTVNVLLALAWWERRRPVAWRGRVETAATIVFLMTLYGMHRLHTTSLQPAGSVGVVQSDVRVNEKWLPERKNAVVERTARLTDLAITEGRPDLVVWPETALPAPMESHPVWRARLTQLTRRTGATVVAGGVMAASVEGSAGRGNVAFAFEPGSRFRDPTPVVHRKQKLVPFVERPGPGLLDLSKDRAGGFIAGRAVTTADGPLGPFGAVICYELTFSEFPRQLRRSGARVLLVLSNDAWLGRSTAPAQHFAHAVLRAVENRMSVVRSANAGISGIVDPLGRVVTRTDAFEEAYAVGPVHRAETVPLAVHIGGFGGPAAVVLLLLLSVAPARRARATRSAYVRGTCDPFGGSPWPRQPSAVHPAPSSFSSDVL